jgi:hypothetical protein
MEAADVPEQPLILAASRSRPRDERAPYHESIAPDLEYDLHLAVGRGLALVERAEGEAPDALIEAIAGYVDAVGAARRRLSADPTDAALALACLFGHQLCRKLGWGWGHVRRTRAPGIVVISADCRYVFGPRATVDAAFDAQSGGVIEQVYRRMTGSDGLPESEPGRYLRLR